jgi:hypothetical protein
MAFSTGTATDPNDLLQKLVTFITANGWTLDSSITNPATAGWRVHAHRSGVYVNMLSMVNANGSPWALGWAQNLVAGGGAIAMYLGSGYNGASAWNAQAGAPVANTTTSTIGVGANLVSGAITSYHFFADSTGDNIAAVFEKSPGVFTFIGWGTSLKLTAGALTGGGQYFYGSSSGYGLALNSASTFNVTLTSFPPSAWDAFQVTTCFVKVDVDTFTGKWIGMSTSTSGVQGYTGKTGSPAARCTATVPGNFPNYNDYGARSFNSLNSQAVLLPLMLFVNRDAGGYSLVGSIPNAFATVATQFGIAPATDLTLGPDTYRIFPNFAIKKV